MAGDAFFLKKRARPRALGPAKAGSGSSQPARPRPATRPPSRMAGMQSKAQEAKAAEKPATYTEFPIYSAEPGTGLRYNLMKLNLTRPADPSTMPQPMLLNRKQPGPKPPPQFAIDAEGKTIGRYLYDEKGKPVLDDDGKPKIEVKQEMDMSLVGTAPGQTNKRRGKRNTKEVFHQDLEVIKLRREEANPWVLENKTADPAPQEYWVGRMLDPGALPTVLLVNDGQSSSFTMVPLGRSYHFEPKRIFDCLDSDEANKMYEAQQKHQVYNRWAAVRPDESGKLRFNAKSFSKGADRVSRFVERAEQRLGLALPGSSGDSSKPSIDDRASGKLNVAKGYFDSKYFDDHTKEKRQVGRSLEGGADEELDFDVNEEFQDDEDSNTFYVNKEEEEERKLQEERQKEEFKLANRNIGDRPQLEDEADEEDEEDTLNEEGRRLRRMMRKRGEEERDLYGSDSSDDSDSDLDDMERELEKQKEKEKEKDQEERNGSRAGSATPGERSSNSPSKKGVPKAGAGAALLAKRAASRGASPSVRSRAGSPLARGSSPDGRAGSPAGRADSPAGRAGSPAGRSGSPSTHGKRKATDSPMRDTPPASADGQQKKKKKGNRGSSTPVPEYEPFPGMITRDEIIQWFKSRGPDPIPLAEPIKAFTKRIKRGGEQEKNQHLLISYIKLLTESVEGKRLKLKAEYM